jgi:hypothetical protein
MEDHELFPGVDPDLGRVHTIDGSTIDEHTEARLGEIRGRLEAIAEALTEVSMDVLREAIEGGATKRPAIDKTIGQARRAVEKAARLLDT